MTAFQGQAAACQCGRKIMVSVRATGGEPLSRLLSIKVTREISGLMGRLAHFSSVWKLDFDLTYSDLGPLT